jgi:hypothetical protein
MSIVPGTRLQRSLLLLAETGSRMLMQGRSKVARDAVAARHFEWLVGVDPAEAEPWWQDLMARALYSERGRAPWPVCGRRI